MCGRSVRVDGLVADLVNILRLHAICRQASRQNIFTKPATRPSKLTNQSPDLLRRGCSSKLALPPFTVMSSLGFSSPHSRSSRVSTSSGFVSYARRMYLRKRFDS